MYTETELLERLPEHPNIDKMKIKELLDNLYRKCKFYQDIRQYFYDYVDSSFPGSNAELYDCNSNEYKEYANYVYGRFEGKVEYDFNDWLKDIQNTFLEKVGPRRTYKEACKLAAETWCDKIFKQHLQDNGAINENHAGGFYACALATILKDKCIDGITEEVIQNAYNGLYDYYIKGCIYHDKKINMSFRVNLYCDYGPNSPLYDILEKAGIPENKINSICPWKTGIDIDTKDNAVIVRGYQKLTYI